MRTLLRQWRGHLLGPPPPLLLTPRLGLRQFVAEDVAEARAIYSDPEVLRFMQQTEPWTEEQIRSTIYGYAAIAGREAEYGQWELAVLRKADGLLIGVCGLIRAELPGEAHLGYQFRRDCWGVGYATEAARAVLELGFVTLGLARITAGCHPDNIASRRVMEKIGLQRRGFVDGFLGAPEGCPALVFSLTREQWESERAGSVEPALAG